jgi:exoribonuclease-2
MLPTEWVDAYSLAEGREVPVLSLYVDVAPDSFEVLATETRVERIRIAANLRHDRLDAVITEESIVTADFDAPFASELSLLWRFARALLARREAVRGRSEPLGRIDYSFELDGEGEHSHVTIRQRRRGAPLDLLVAELMIFANSTWGKWLAERGVAGIYRSQAMGRVRMSTATGPHRTARMMRISLRSFPASMRPTRPTRSSSSGWSATGRNAGSGRRTSGASGRR